MGQMSILSSRGDDKVTWDPAIKESVDKARAKFDELRKTGMSAFVLGPDGKGARMDEFDPAAGAIVFVTPQRGG